MYENYGLLIVMAEAHVDHEGEPLNTLDHPEPKYPRHSPLLKMSP